jgi:hypothetical protein
MEGEKKKSSILEMLKSNWKLIIIILIICIGGGGAAYWFLKPKETTDDKTDNESGDESKDKTENKPENVTENKSVTEETKAPEVPVEPLDCVKQQDTVKAFYAKNQDASKFEFTEFLETNKNGDNKCSYMIRYKDKTVPAGVHPSHVVTMKHKVTAHQFTFTPNQSSKMYELDQSNAHTDLLELTGDFDKDIHRMLISVYATHSDQSTLIRFTYVTTDGVVQPIADYNTIPIPSKSDPMYVSIDIPNGQYVVLSALERAINADGTFAPVSAGGIYSGINDRNVYVNVLDEIYIPKGNAAPVKVANLLGEKLIYASPIKDATGKITKYNDYMVGAGADGNNPARKTAITQGEWKWASAYNYYYTPLTYQQ